jgi:hypothetical protein
MRSNGSDGFGLPNGLEGFCGDRGPRTLLLRNGTRDPGAGTCTVMAQIAADALGLTYRRARPRPADRSR